MRTADEIRNYQRNWAEARSPAQKEATKERKRLTYQARRDADPEAHRELHYQALLKFKFGLTPIEYEAMLIAQSGLCEICGGFDDDCFLSVDHDHDTLELRGLLCRTCNRGLGDLKGNLEGAKWYLMAHGGI